MLNINGFNAVRACSYISPSVSSGKRSAVADSSKVPPGIIFRCGGIVPCVAGLGGRPCRHTWLMPVIALPTCLIHRRGNYTHLVPCQSSRCRGRCYALRRRREGKGERGWPKRVLRCLIQSMAVPAAHLRAVRTRPTIHRNLKA